MSFTLSSLKDWFKNLPSGRQIQKFFEVLDRKERKIFLILLALFSISFVYLAADFYIRHTEIKPTLGDKISEGVIGQPRYINPVLAAANDVDRDLTELVFAGLMKYSKDNQIVADLANDYEIKEDGKVWDVNLRENLVFQDGSPLTADDVIFTVKTIQNPEYKSPLRPNWLGVEVERLSDLKIRFRLKNPYPGFIETLTLKILPKKIWAEVTPESFSLTVFNLKPIGSGPYRVTKILQEKNETARIQSLTLEINPKYYGRLPNIKEIVFVFFDEEKDLIKAAKSKEVQSFVLPSLKDKELLESKGFISYRFDLPRYFSVFFNQKDSLALSQKDIRTALNYATNKREIIDQALFGNGKVVDSPILPSFFGLSEPKTAVICRFSLKKANEILDKAGFALDQETGIRQKTINKKLAFEFKSTLAKGSQGTEVIELQKCLAKDAEIYPEAEVSGIFGDKTKQAVIRFQEKYRENILVPADLKNGNGEVKTLTRKKLNDYCFGPNQENVQLKLSLITVEDPTLLKTAEILKSQWAKAGVSLEIRSYGFSQLSSEFLKPRNYESLLFGEVLGQVPDLFPFWHSLQKKDPGLNLALYESSEADKLLEEARQIFDESQRQEKLEQLQEVILKDVPAVFLYQPDFIYLASPIIKNIETGPIADPSKRFTDIENWYIKTRRDWK